jgi:hypothetical protein
VRVWGDGLSRFSWMLGRAVPSWSWRVGKWGRGRGGFDRFLMKVRLGWVVFDDLICLVFLCGF